MITPSEWVGSLLNGLRAVFGRRLLYIGLQGSHQRGEATESSDIDVVTVLDTVSVADLERYRSTVRAMPICVRMRHSASKARDRAGRVM